MTYEKIVLIGSCYPFKNDLTCLQVIRSLKIRAVEFENNVRGEAYKYSWDRMNGVIKRDD